MRYFFAGKTINIVNLSHNVDELPLDASLKILSDSPLATGGARIVVLSDLVELNNQTEEYYSTLADSIAASGVHQVWVAGTTIQHLYDLLPKHVRGGSFLTVETLFERLPVCLRHLDVLMFKGAEHTGLYRSLRKWIAETGRGTSPDAAKITNDWVIQTILLEGENDFSGSPFTQPTENLSALLIQAAAKAKNYVVHPLTNRCFKIQSERSVAIVRSSAPVNSMPADHICKNKQATKNLLAHAGFPVPNGQVFEDELSATRYFNALPDNQGIVVKPVDGSDGYGVSKDIRDINELASAWKAARKHSKKIILEEHIAGLDLRVFVLSGVTRAVIVRIPFGVTGTGKSTIKELLDQKALRISSNPLTQNFQLDSDSFLERKGIPPDYVPRQGERVNCQDNNPSISTEFVEVSRALHPRLLSFAENAARTIPDLHLACIHLIVKDISQQPENGNAFIISVNSMPDISCVSFVNYGAIVDLPSLLVDFVIETPDIYKPPAETPRVLPAQPLPQQSSLMLSSNSALLRQAAHRRGIPCFSPSSGITELEQGEHRLLFYSGMSNRTSSVARDATNDKNWTCTLLREAGLNTPTGRYFNLDQMNEAWQFSAELGIPVVVKPLIGSGGRGVTTDIKEREHFTAAWHYACAKARSGILVEEYVKGRDFRVVVIDSRIVSVTERIPAYVTGDGRSSIGKLLELKNIERTKNPYYAVKPMLLSEMNLRNLEVQGLNIHSVLERGRRLQLHTVANIGAGGESCDKSDDIHPDWAELMVKARVAVFNPIHVGIDLIAEDVSESPHHQRWTIIEVNTNPDLAMIHFPGEGTPRDLAGALLDALIPPHVANTTSPESCRVTISGKVHNVGYRRWMKKQAIQHGIGGWVRNNNTHQTVEAELFGMHSAIQSLVKLLEKGPRAAQVDAVSILATPAAKLDDFIVMKSVN